MSLTLKLTTEMKKSIILATLLFFACLGANAQDPSYEIKVGDVTMKIDAEKGAKILSCTYAGKEVISQMNVPNWFGSTFWTSPQKEWNWPPVPEHDSSPYTVEEKDGAIIMTSSLSEKIPLRIRKKFSTDEVDNAIVIEYSIINESGAQRKVAPWEITRVPAEGGTVLFEAPVESIWPENLMAFNNENGVAWYSFDEAQRNRKVNADGKGWLAYAGNGLLLVKKFEDIPADAPAPGEAEVQVYVNRGNTYVELESQGAYKTLENGESLSWTVRWYLSPLDTTDISEIIAKLK